MQSSNNPEAFAIPKEFDVAVHLRNVPEAIACPFVIAPPNDPLPAEQSSNNPDAKDESVPNDPFPPIHFLYVPEYSVALRIPLSLVPLNTQFSI